MKAQTFIRWPKLGLKSLLLYVQERYIQLSHITVKIIILVTKSYGLSSFNTDKS